MAEGNIVIGDQYEDNLQDHSDRLAALASLQRAQSAAAMAQERLMKSKDPGSLATTHAESYESEAQTHQMPYLTHTRVDVQGLRCSVLGGGTGHMVNTEGVTQQQIPHSQIYTPGHTSGIEAAHELRMLRSRVAELEAKLQTSAPVKEVPKPPRYQILNSFGGAEFEDEPEVVHGREGSSHLRCRVRVVNLELYLVKNPDISFVVHRQYDQFIRTTRGKRSNSTPDFHIPRPLTEKISPVCENSKRVFDVLLKRDPAFRDIFDEYRSSEELMSPYLFLYHSRNNIDEIQATLSPPEQEQLGLILQYISEAFGLEYSLADDLLTNGMMMPECIQYLVKPGDTLVQNLGGQYHGLLAESWLMEGSVAEMQLRTNDEDQESELSDPSTKFWNIDCKSLGFDGNFFWISHKLSIELRNDHSSFLSQGLSGISVKDVPKMIPINELNFYPLRYASEQVLRVLKQRGSRFWRCRTKSLVSYHPDEKTKFGKMTGDRYMIDMRTFHTLHDPLNIARVPRTSLGLDIISTDDRFQYLLPSQIKGYNLQRKIWNDLMVDRISDVEWNREAFHTLVIDPKAKDLIEALIVSQLETEKSTDIISGKGNGLILLFHGGPGTGKTLTAEGVAEIAKKPLYRVTCGDVGTKPEDVEKYLDSVLHLGHIWDCVVLLDEADVFLEQRSLEDLQRNALVSVFLRVLEYYEGILILTSNRVGTFDEAFVSRIQLSLHYPDLGTRERLQIWRTFFDRLDRMDENINMSDLQANLDALKHEKLNGRQIRNVITTARQYAKWRKVELRYEHLKDVIEISGRFCTYLDRLKGGYSAAELAKDSGIR
ncbi:hypothetical protein N7540_011795 [Penicillium herquei]|nr:hypothetical protein N7540_011795 [Penicillium herquei]